jgi:hypothetical protein
LSLRESHGPTRVAKVGVPRSCEQLEELAQLLTRCGRTRRLTERHGQPCHTVGLGLDKVDDVVEGESAGDGQDPSRLRR